MKTLQSIVAILELQEDIDKYIEETLQSLRESLDNIHLILDEYEDNKDFNTKEDDELSPELLSMKLLLEYLVDKMNEIENQLNDINKENKTDICNIK